MAGEWLKFELSTPDKPEVLRMARLLNIDKDAVIGKMIRLWAWFDRNSVDGNVDGVVDADVDALCHHVGFSDALVSVGWLVLDKDNERVSLPKFDRHNGKTAKKRALKNERQARWRSAGVDEEETVVRLPERLPEKRREEVNTSPALPDWLPKDAWNSYVEMRKKIRKPPTDRAIQLVIAELSKLKAKGHAPAEVLEQSVRNSWQDVFPLRAGASTSDSLVKRAAV